MNNLTIPDLDKTGAFPAIWTLQEALLVEYQKIEGLPLWPLNLDTKDSQELMKDLIARVTEELAESYEAYIAGDMPNAKEEMADALHFLMECLIFSTHQEAIPFVFCASSTTTLFAEMLDGVYHVDVVNWFWRTTYYLNIARNNLRNKKWKKTQVLAQKTLFMENMVKALHSLISGFQLWAMTEQEIFEIYYKKNKINWFRIRSNYVISFLMIVGGLWGAL